MTDLLEDVDDLLSTREVTPKAAAEPSEPIGKPCPVCGKTKNKLGIPFLTNAAVGAHQQSAHGDPKTRTAKKATGAKKATATPRSTPPRRRNVAELIGKFVLQAGRFVNAAVDPPTGAAIMFEAGALGVAVDRVIAGTIIDKPLQMGAAMAEKWEPLVPLVTLPILTLMISKNPALVKQLEGELREALEDVLIQSLPLLKKRAERTRDTVTALAELKALDPSLAQSDDPIGELIQSFFTPPQQPPSGDGEPGQ